MKRKLLSSFALALLTAASAWAYDFKSGDLYYNITDEAAKTVEVTYEEQNENNYKALSAVVNIPRTVEYNNTEYKITSIGNLAFMYCSVLTQVTIPNSVESIGNYAFYYCSALTQVTIPNSVTSIGDGAFSSCSKLTSINVESGNTTYCSVDGILFNIDKTTLVEYPAGKLETTYVIPSSVTSIGNSAFSYCSALTQVTIGNSVTSIGDEAFYYCSKLTEVTIPDGVTSIGYSAFRYCEALTQVTIPDGVTSIGNSAFSDCSALTQVTWNAINYKDFSYATANPFYDSRNTITNFTFGEQVEHIPAYLCYEMYRLTQITIPNSVTSIGERAFYHCSALTQVTIGNRWKALETRHSTTAPYLRK